MIDGDDNSFVDIPVKDKLSPSKQQIIDFYMYNGVLVKVYKAGHADGSNSSTAKSKDMKW